MNIVVKVIPHTRQRYNTCGDWFYKKDGSLQIRVSVLKNWRYETLIAVHELVEVLICRAQGVSTKSVDEFDMQYEKDRENGLHDFLDEPGDDPKAPYHFAHGFATAAERMLAAALGVAWGEYSEAVLKLYR